MTKIALPIIPEQFYKENISGAFRDEFICITFNEGFEEGKKYWDDNGIYCFTSDMTNFYFKEKKLAIVKLPIHNEGFRITKLTGGYKVNMIEVYKVYDFSNFNWNSFPLYKNIVDIVPEFNFVWFVNPFDHCYDVYDWDGKWVRHICTK